MAVSNENKYLEGESILKEAGLYASVSDVYGLVVGMIASGIKAEDPAFLEYAVQLMNDGEPLPGSAVAWIKHIATDVVTDIVENDKADILIPDDDTPIRDRAHALAEFAHSFVTGFSCKQKVHSKLSNDLQEMLRDIMDIAGIDEDIPEGENSERDFMLIYEHVAIGVCYAFEECAAALYPKAQGGEFVLEEDDDEGRLVELSEKRKKVHEEEEALWEKQARLSARR